MVVKRRAIASPSESATLKNGRRLSDDSTAKTHTRANVLTHTESDKRHLNIQMGPGGNDKRQGKTRIK